MMIEFNWSKRLKNETPCKRYNNSEWITGMDNLQGCYNANSKNPLWRDKLYKKMYLKG